MNRRRFLDLLASATLLGACGKQETAPGLGLATGQPMPQLEFPDLEHERAVSIVPGQPTLLNFWATWCPPCRHEMGGLDRLYRRWEAAGLGVFGISIDDDVNLVREFVLQQSISFPILLDRAGQTAAGSLGLKLYPTTILVGRDGRVAAIDIGEREWDGPLQEESVRKLMG